MASSTIPIIWDFYREIPEATDLALVAYQYDTMGQSIYLSNGLKTKIGEVDHGHWRDQILGEEIMISENQYDKTAWDQPFQNLLAGAAIINGKVYYLRYDWITSLLTDQEPE